MRNCLLTLSMLIGFGGCAQPSAHTCQPDLVAVDFGAFFKNRMDTNLFAEVKISGRQTALDILQLRKIVEIDALTRQGLLEPSQLQDKPELRYFLVLARRATDGGRITVFSHDTRVLVLHGDLGPLKCRDIFDSAIIIATKETLTDAFASTSVSH